MKHVYIFCMKSSGIMYGIGTYIRQLVEFLQRREDISLNIVELHSDEKEFYVKEYEGYRIFYFPKIINLHISLNNPNYNRNVWFILQSFITINPSDQLIFHLNYTSEHSFVKYFKINFPSCKVIFTIHFMKWCSFLKGNSDYFREIIQKNESALLNENEKSVYQSYEKDKRIGQIVDTIICLSQFTRDILINDYSLSKDKIELIPNGLKDEGIQLSKEKKNIVRQVLGFTQNDFIILFAGRLEEAKGVDFLIKAFKGISDIYPNARLVLIGDGEFSKYLSEAKGYWSKITFTGRLEKDDLYQFYQIADVGVIPSINEQCSYVAIEMMMFSLPMIIANSTGLADMLSFENKEDYMVHIQTTTNDTIISIDELKEKILNICNDNRSKHNIRVNYEKKFRLDLMKNNYLHLYDSFRK